MHSSHVICMAVPEWLEPFWHSSSASAWHYLRARMARAILALPTIFECHNGLSHSGTALYTIFECQNGSSHSGTEIMHPAVPEWLGPFLHSSHATGRVIMARAILALKSCNLHGCARMARAILHSSSASGVTCRMARRMARAILALPTIFECHIMA